METKILNPISGDNPAGADLRQSKELDHLRALRKEEDRTISYDVWVHPLKIANWDLLKEESENLLTRKTKDLQILIWFTECFEKNFQGLKQGLSLINEFIQMFFETFYPLDIATRLSLLEWMERVYTDRLMVVPFVASEEDLTLDRWRYALFSRDQQIDLLRKKLLFMSVEYTHQLKEIVEDCLLSVKEIKTFLGQRMKDSPTFNHLMEGLNEILGILDYRLEQQVVMDLETQKIAEPEIKNPQPSVEILELLDNSVLSPDMTVIEKINDLVQVLKVEGYIQAAELVQFAGEMVKKYGKMVKVNE